MESTHPKRTHKEGRTAEWVEQQSAVRYSSMPYDPPPSPTPPAPVSRTSSATTRTTSGSEQSFAGPSSSSRTRRGVPPSPSLMQPVSSLSSPVSPSHERAFPFPQSPPGSGYPMVLQVDPPRADSARPMRPSLLKKRRPSLVDQVKSFGSSNTPWKRDDGAKR